MKQRQTSGKDPRQEQAPSKPTAKASKPREASNESAPKGGNVVEEHEHLAAPMKRRQLADIGEGQDKPAAAKKDEKVSVRIPRAFNLQVMHPEGHGSQTIRYEAGIDEMPRSHAEHSYAVANGVEIVEEGSE